jgi:hypothetical protein
VGDIPLDAQRVVDELRASRRQVAAEAPKCWTPPESFDSAVTRLVRAPAHESEHLAWMHANWDLTSFLAPPPQRGVKGGVKRIVHRLVMAVLGPYLSHLQDYLAVNNRAVDTVARRSDADFTAHQRLIEAVRADLVDFAHHVDERANG